MMGDAVDIFAILAGEGEGDVEVRGCRAVWLKHWKMIRLCRPGRVGSRLSNADVALEILDLTIDVPRSGWKRRLAPREIDESRGRDPVSYDRQLSLDRERPCDDLQPSGSNPVGGTLKSSQRR